MQSPRLKDIAEKVSVSSTAVSRVLNDLPIRISKEKRESILGFAASLGYRPNLLARGLRSKRTRCIGIVVPDMSTLFYPELIQAIEKRLSFHGYRMIICDTGDDLSQERVYVEDLLSRQIEGLIVAPASGEGNIEIFESLARRRFPLILMDRYFPGKTINYVVTDNRLAARKAVRVISKKNPSRLFYLGGERRNFAVDERLAGVKDECLSKGIRFLKSHVFLTGMTRQDVRKTSRLMFGKEFNDTAIFLESNRFLMGVLDIACKKRLSIPKDFAVIGFDTFRAEMETRSDFDSLGVLKEPIPVIKQPISAMANLVTQYIFSPGERRKWRVKLSADINIR